MVVNNTQTWFKVLYPDGSPIDGSNEDWSLPLGKQEGAEMNFTGQKALTYMEHGVWDTHDAAYGTWLVSNPLKHYLPNSNARIYVAKPLEAISPRVLGTIWVERVKLIRPATNLDLKPFGIHRALQ